MTVAVVVRTVCNKYALLGNKVQSVGKDHIIVNDSLVLLAYVDGKDYGYRQLFEAREILVLPDNLLIVRDKVDGYGLYDVDRGWRIPCYYYDLHYEGFGIFTAKQLKTQGAYSIVDADDNKITQLMLWQRYNIGNYLVGVVNLTREFAFIDLRNKCRLCTLDAHSVMVTDKLCLALTLGTETISTYSIIYPDLSIEYIGADCRVSMRSVNGRVCVDAIASSNGKLRKILTNTPVICVSQPKTGLFYKYTDV